MTQQDPRLASYSKWLIANQDRRDTPEFQKVANAYKQIRANSLSQPQQATQTSADYNPAGTGFSRAVERGALQTGAGYYAAKGNITANTIRGMSQSNVDLARRTLNEALKRPLDTPIDQAVLDQGMSLSDALNYYSAQGVLNDRQRDAAEERFNRLTAKAKDFRENRLEDETQKMEEAFASAGSLMERAQALPKSQRAALYQQALSEAPDTFKGWLSTITDDPIGFMTFAGETVAESAPAIGAGLATTAVTGNPILGSAVMATGSGLREYGNEVTGFLAENGVDLQDPQQVQALFRNPELMQKAAQRGLTRALVIAAAEAAGQGAVATKLFGGNVLKQTGTQMVTEGGGEALATASVGDEFSLKDTLTEGIIGGASAVPEAAVAGKSFFNKKGDFDPSKLTNQEKLAGADVARILQSVVEENGYNLKDLDVSSEKGAKKALEAVRRKIISRIDEITKNKEIKKYFNSATAKTLGDIDLFAEANGGIKAAKNKVADRVTQSQIDAIRRLMPPTQEAQELLNLMAMSNVTTDLFNRGMKGGISRYTDYFNPLIKDGSYDPSRMANIIVGTSSTYALGPAATAGIVAGGRTVDAITGRRSVLNRFLKKNIKNEGLADPGGPSLLRLKELQKKLEQQKLDASKQETLELNRALYDEGVDPAGLDGTMDKASPEAQMMLALEVNTPDGRFGPDRATINSAVQAIIDNPDSPKALVKAAETYLTNIRDGGKIPKLTPLIQAVKREINSNPEVYGRTRASQLSQGPAFSGNVPRTPSGDGSSAGDNTSSPAYQAGIQRNIDRVQVQQDVVSSRPDIPDAEKTAMLEALERLKQPLTNPVVAVQYEMTRLINDGATESNVIAAFTPILEAVTSQQRQAQGLQTPTESTQRPALETNAPTPPQALSEAPAVLTNEDDTKFDMEPPAIPALSSDRLTMNFTDVTKRTPELQEGQRKLQSGEITRDEYADLVNKFKPVLPYQTAPAPATVQDAKYALANGKGQSDKKAAKYGEPTKVLQPGQRIQLRLDIPSYNQHGTWVVSVHEPNSRPDSTAEGRFKAGPVIGYESAMAIKNADLGMLQRPAQKIAEGSPKGTIATMLGDYMPMSPSEAQAYQQNAIEQSLQPGSGFAQVGMDPERHSYFYDRNTMQPIVSAEEIVQVGPLVIAKNPQYAPTDDFVFDQEPPALPALQDVVPTGTNSNVPMETAITRSFTTAKNTVYRKGRDLKLDLQKQALKSQKLNKVNLQEMSPENVGRLSDFALYDALEALKTNQNAIGWYEGTIDKMIDNLSGLYPEIRTNQANRLQFFWALAATSNGTKVDKNLDLAVQAYEHLQRTGRFPSDIGIGEAAAGINSGLASYHTMLDKLGGDHKKLEEFALSKQTVKEIQNKYGVKISGEGANTVVRGASVIGPKIGNGFFSNLYGEYDALTMDRWLMRTVGRWRGTLVKKNKPMERKKRDELWNYLRSLDDDQIERLKQLYTGTRTKISNKTMSDAALDKLANSTAKLSTSKPWREAINQEFADVRLVGNALAGYLDGQVEAPAGPKERTFIREVFEDALATLNNTPEVRAISNKPLTMADFQALLWYQEKLLYDTAKLPIGEESKGYKDEEAPDYANAAQKLVDLRRGDTGRDRLGSLGSVSGRGRGTGPSDDGQRGQPLSEGSLSRDDSEPPILSRATERAVAADDIRADEQSQAGRSEGVGSLALQGATRNPQVVNSLNGLNNPDTLNDFLSRPGWAIITATDENLPDSIRDTRNAENNAYLEQQLNEQGIPYLTVAGAYQGVDQGPSFLILADEETAMKLGKRHLQESILTNNGLVYTRRPGATTPTTGQNMFGPQALQQDFYSTVSGLPFSMGLDFNIGPGQQFYKPGYIEAPNRPQLPMRERDGMVELHHWSNNRRKTIDPHFAGSGPLKGVERKRAAKISFFGIAPRQGLRDPGTGYVKEYGLGPYEHIALINPKDLYPVFQDPDGLLKGVGADWSKAEDIIRDAGYKGYYTTDDGSGSAPLGNVATLFEPIEVSEVRDNTQSRDDREPGLLPALREGRDKLGANFSRRPQRQEVVDQFPPVKALFEIGKKGSPYENGITDLDQALELARALNITVQLYLHQSQMMAAQGRKNTGTVRGSFRKKPNGASGTVFALREHARIGDKNTDRVSSLDELTTVLHEIFHGVTMGPMSGEGPMINGNGTNSVENAIGSMIEKPQGKRTREEREIIYEVKRLQDQLDVYIEGNPRDRRSVRLLNKALQDLEDNRMRMTPEQQMQQEQALDNYKNYIRSKAEFAVDPFWVYAVNPKLAKQVMPVTTKWIQKNLRQAGNKNIQFYSHPFAVSVAVMMAILAAQDAEDEEKKQQQQQPMMQPGALSPMPGMLTAA